MARKMKQPRLLPAVAPITETDSLDFAALTTHYACPCGHRAETQTPLPAVRCTRCGGTMTPTDAAEPRGRDPPL